MILWIYWVKSKSPIRNWFHLRFCISPKLPRAEKHQGYQDILYQQRKTVWWSEGNLWENDHINSELIIAKKENGQQDYTQHQLLKSVMMSCNKGYKEVRASSNCFLYVRAVRTWTCSQTRTTDECKVQFWTRKLKMESWLGFLISCLPHNKVKGSTLLWSHWNQVQVFLLNVTHK